MKARKRRRTSRIQLCAGAWIIAWPALLSAARELDFRLHVIDAESTYSACAAVDVNRDGRTDIYSGGWWYEAPSWKKHLVREVETIRGRFDDYSNLPIDVDGDGWIDIVSANYRSGKLYWIEHPGEPLAPWRAHLIEQPGPMETARLVDIDGDGRLDVLPDGVRFAAWWEIAAGGSGSSPRWIRHELPAAVAGHGVGFGDVDGDGHGDVVGPRGWLRAPADAREGSWTWHGDFELSPDSGIPILVLDVDGDGDSDLVWARGHRFGLYWLEQVRRKSAGGEQVSWTRHAVDTAVSQFHSLLYCDLDGDARMEVVAGRRYMGHEGRDPGEYDPLGLYSYQFDPDSRTFERALISWGDIAGFGLDPKAVDLDGDGDLDLIGAGRSGLVWLENRRLREDGDARGRRALRPPPPAYEDHSRPLLLKTSQGKLHPITTPADWFLRRSQILQGAELVMGALPGPERRVPLDVELIEETDTPRYVRKKLSYCAEPGDRVPAYLLVPKGLRGKAPAMLCLHQTTGIGKGSPAGLGGRPTLHYAHELAERGYVCLAPDYPSFGDYEFDFQKARDRYPSGTMKAIWNNIRAVDLLESLPEVAADRIGCIGHSLGGHNAIFTAVFDRRIRAVVSSCGFTAFHRYYGGKLAGWTSDRYMPRIREVYGSDPDRMPFDFHELVAALAPRAFFASAPLHDDNFDVTGVRDVIQRAREVYELLGAGDRLEAVYPDSDHDFPDALRSQCYAWLDRQLE